MDQSRHAGKLTTAIGGPDGIASLNGYQAVGRTPSHPVAAPAATLRRYPLVVAAVFAALLILFLLGDAWGASLLADPTPRLRHGDAAAAVVGVGLLAADAILPVPASLVMIAHGAAFGVVLGTVVSLAGGMAAAVVGFALGRRGTRLLERFVPAAERAAADRLLERHGALAIVVSRPVPLLAETVSVLAGASSIGWGRAMLAALAGTLPAALVYALAGAAVADVGGAVLVIGGVLAVAGGAWLVEQRLARGIRRWRTQGSTKPVVGMAPHGIRRR